MPEWLRAFGSPCQTDASDTIRIEREPVDGNARAMHSQQAVQAPREDEHIPMVAKSHGSVVGTLEMVVEW